MKDQIFADGIGAIAIVGTTVRIDLVILSDSERDELGQPRMVPQGRIIMSAEAFLRANAKLQEAQHALARMMGAKPAAEPAQPAAEPPEPVILPPEPRPTAPPRPKPAKPFP